MQPWSSDWYFSLPFLVMDDVIESSRLLETVQCQDEDSGGWNVAPCHGWGGLDNPKQACGQSDRRHYPACLEWNGPNVYVVAPLSIEDVNQH